MKNETINENIIQFGFELEFSDMLNILKEVNIDLFEKFVSKFKAPNFTKQKLKRFLYEHDASLYIMMQAIEQNVVNCFWLAMEAKNTLQLTYYRERLLRKRLVDDIKTETTKLELKKTKKTKKRRRENAIKEDWFIKKEAWDNDLNQSSYKIIRGKSNNATLEKVDLPEWKTLYHCDGLWKAEELLHIIQENNFKCSILINTGIPSDLDMLRYRVISNEPY